MIPIRYNGQERLPLNDEKNASHVRRNEKDIPGTFSSFCASGACARINWALCFRFHQAGIKVLARLQSHLRLGVLCRAHSDCGRIYFYGCRI